MGLFLAMSGIAGAPRPAVIESLRKYTLSKNGYFEPMVGSALLPEVLVVAEAKDNRITVLYPGNFMEWDEASAHLSRSLGAPVFSFHIHDDDLWMYVLFAHGEEVDHFNPIPDYWFEDLPEGERDFWAGDSGVVARHWPGIEAAAIQKYLVRWDLYDEEPGKASDDDRFRFNDFWQLTDFMRRLGLQYPMDDQGRGLGDLYRFEVGQS